MLLESICTRAPARPLRHWALGLLAAALMLTGCESQADNDKAATDAAYREKLAKAQAIFAERCKSAGVVIHRTVKDVEGIELKRIRPKLEFGDKRYFDPMFEGAAMAGEQGGVDYIKQFLMYEFRSPDRPTSRGSLGPMTLEARRTRPDARKGYAFIEYVDAKDQKRHRCRPDWSLNHPNWIEGQLKCEQVTETNARYALDYENLVDSGDRAHWVAGTKLRVIERQSGETVAELTRFVIDPGFGVSTTGRWPWSHAASAASNVCPSDATRLLGHESRYFVDSVLIPKQGD
ncbi:hypothetical protein [Inhella crocodyli]|uniref:Lipoprotein n=1 Tax=Inhella crocodyli TaxID=2499851 RepID=A0A3S2Y007_9BURK|nr:hypothetical protein [Inhella crocodyli]RVT88712.1 hypothetical protein EOD73_07025 [Inhella crocodyli]